jgi:hypothetical protein
MDAGTMLYLCALLNSMVVDFVIRRKLLSSSITKSVMATLPIPDPPSDSSRRTAIIALAGRLICRSTVFEELAGVVGVPCGPLDREEEVRLRVELDAHVAHLYGLSREQFVRVLADFKRSRGEGPPVPPDDTYKHAVLAAYLRLR